jgi:multiple sugar transport system permease protein
MIESISTLLAPLLAQELAVEALTEPSGVGAKIRTAIGIGVLVYLVLFVAVWVLGRVKGNPRLLKTFATYTVLVLLGLLMAFPFYWMIATSFKTPQEALASPPTWWPGHGFQWDNYRQAWNLNQQNPTVTFTRYFTVSLMTSAMSTTGALFTAIMAAYAFAKMKFIGQGIFFYLMLAMMMVPGQVLLVPNFVTLDQLGWIDTYAALIVPWMASMFAIFLLRQFMMSIPDDLWDAAQIDGANRFRFLWTVVVPLSVPSIISAGIFLFLGNWNSLLWPLIVTNSPEMRTIQVGLQTFESAAGTDFHLLMAASTIVILPVIILFFFAQRYFIQGITRTGIK